MGIIKTAKLVYEYIQRDEENKVTEVNRAVDAVDVNIEAGEFVAILGHNGSGKSTLAKHMNALLLPTEGTIWVEEDDTKNESALWKIRQTAGMVFQNPDNQIVASIVEEDVGFGPENMGVETRKIWERVDESLKAVGMTAYRRAEAACGHCRRDGDAAQMHCLGRAYRHAGPQRPEGSDPDCAGTE